MENLEEVEVAKISLRIMTNEDIIKKIKIAGEILGVKGNKNEINKVVVENAIKYYYKEEILKKLQQL